MRIRCVVEGDFRWSEYGVWLKYVNEKKNGKYANRALLRTLGVNDVIAFVSKTGNQVLFIHGFQDLENAKGEIRMMLPSKRHRIIDGTWDYRMLVDYAEKEGIKIVGLPAFRDYFSHVRDRTVRKVA